MTPCITHAMSGVAILGLLGCVATPETRSQTLPSPCTGAWYRYVEQRVGSGDGYGHGPDVGSSEWKSVIEFRLGIRGLSTLPDPQSRAWCEYIDTVLEKSR